MSDPIDRQAVLKAMDTWDKFGCDPDGKLVRYDDDKHYVPYVHYGDMVHAIKHMPSAEKRGKWERHWSRPGVYADLCWHCTACGGYTDMQFAHVVYKFCPFCGATMERGTDE